VSNRLHAVKIELPRKLGLEKDRTPPGPEVPPEIVSTTRARYVEAYERLTARRWE